MKISARNILKGKIVEVVKGRRRHTSASISVVRS
jgi:molybdopterin-binding protein